MYGRDYERERKKEKRREGEERDREQDRETHPHRGLKFQLWGNRERVRGMRVGGAKERGKGEECLGQESRRTARSYKPKSQGSAQAGPERLEC